MTNREINELKAKLFDLLSNYEELKIFIIVNDPSIGRSHYFGNHCPVCAFEDLEEWIEESNIRHTDNKKGSIN